MGAVLGLLFSIGVLLIWQVFAEPAQPRVRTGRSVRERLDDLIAAAGLESVSAPQLIGSSVGAGLVIGLVFFVLSGTAAVALVFAVLAGSAPFTLVRYRARQRRQELRELWPDVVDNLASAVRAGLSLPEGLSQLGVRGPEALRRPFARFGEEYRASGRFHACLDQLKERLADPTGDRIVESLRIAREVGGTDLGRLLRTLSSFLRDDARTRAELEARQSAVVNGARLAVSAPWILLAVFSLRNDSVRRYDSPAGVTVLAIGAGICVVAYRLMVRIGRLPEEERVLR